MNKKIELLEQGDQIVLWASLGGLITATVETVTEYPESGTVGVGTDELEWAELVATRGTLVVLDD